jgi:hypothetical protein
MDKRYLGVTTSDGLYVEGVLTDERQDVGAEMLWVARPSALSLLPQPEYYRASFCHVVREHKVGRKQRIIVKVEGMSRIFHIESDSYCPIVVGDRVALYYHPALCWVMNQEVGDDAGTFDAGAV